MNDRTINKYLEVYVVCEGQTEQAFVNTILKEYFASKNLGLIGTLCDQRGGDVKFERFALKFSNYLKTRPDVYVTTLVDFEGMSKKWPGYESACRQIDAQAKALLLCEETKKALQTKFPEQDWKRFIPYVSMFEFEGLLFSSPKIIADVLKINVCEVQKICDKYNSPEEINDSPTTKPSARLKKLKKDYKKTRDGLKIAERIGIDVMRERCAVFNRWITTLEGLSDVAWSTF